MSSRAAKRNKLNSIRTLESRKIEHQVLDYDSTIRDARLVAESLGMPPEMVFKTLVLQATSGKKPILALIPSNTSLNLKRLAKAIGEKKMALVSHANAEKLTGLQVGGISPLALLNKGWRVYIDRRAAECAQIVMSAGQRGRQVQLETAALLKLVAGELLDMADPM